MSDLEKIKNTFNEIGIKYKEQTYHEDEQHLVYLEIDDGSMVTTDFCFDNGKFTGIG